MTLEDLIGEVIGALEERGIDYMISGSLAMSAYTMPRMTRDVDIVIELDHDSLGSFVSIFKANFYLHRASIEEEISKRGMFNVIDNRSGYKIDFVIRKNIPYRKLEFERRIRSNVLGYDAWLVTPEDLIISKIIWIQEIQSDLQKADIRNLLENVEVDMKYIYYWTKALNLKTFNLLE